METNAREEQSGHCPVHFRDDNPRLNWAQERVKGIYISKILGANFAGVVPRHGNDNKSENLHKPK